MITKTQQRLQAKYGTYDEAEIIKQMKSGTVTKDLPTNKSGSVKLTGPECNSLCAAAGLEYLDGYENRVIEYTLSDERVDRDGDILIQQGGELENFKANPVTLLFHDSRDFPVGNCIKIWYDSFEKSTKGWMLFLDDRVDPTGRADRTFRFAKSRAMRSGSIGFRGKEVKFPSLEERQILGMKDWGVIFTRWELGEFSFCPVPSNVGAVSAALRKGILLPEDLDFIEQPKDEVLDMTKEELDAFVKDGLSKATADLKAEIETLKGQKAGKRISAANMKKLTDMHDHMTSGCKMLKDLIDDHADPEEEEDKAAEVPVEKTAEEKELEELAAFMKAESK